MTHSCGCVKKDVKNLWRKNLNGVFKNDLDISRCLDYVKFHHKNLKAYKNIFRSKRLIVGDLEFYQILPHFPHVLFTTGI